MNAILSRKGAKRTSFIKPKPLSLWALTNVTDYNLLLYIVYNFCFSVCLSSHTIPHHIIGTSGYYFATYIFWEFVSCPNKPDEVWYWPVEMSYTQAFSRCLISPSSSPFDFHFCFKNVNTISTFNQKVRYHHHHHHHRHCRCHHHHSLTATEIEFTTTRPESLLLIWQMANNLLKYRISIPLLNTESLVENKKTKNKKKVENHLELILNVKMLLRPNQILNGNKTANGDLQIVLARNRKWCSTPQSNNAKMD